jgi:hypothetical protein
MTVVLNQPTILAAAIEEDVGGSCGVLGNCYDVIIAAAAARATERTLNTHRRIWRGQRDYSAQRQLLKAVDCTSRRDWVSFRN